MKKLITLLFFVLLLSACTITPATAPTPTTSGLRGRLTFAGSTTIQPLAHTLGEAFQSQNPDVSLEIAAGGSVVGIESIHNGAADIGMSSRHLSDAESQGISLHPIAIDVLAIVVNPANPVSDLSLEQLRGIYLGEITNWQQVGGSNELIEVIVRETTSGTRGAFDEIVLNKQEPQAPNLRAAITAGDMAALVSQNPHAIGYVGFGNLDASLKVLSIGGILPSPESARNGAYPLIRPLLLLTGPLSQPLAQEFIKFALSPEGQTLIEQSGWIPAQ